MPYRNNTEHCQLSLCFTNIRSILPKRIELCSYLDNCECDILVLTETWLHQEIRNDEVLPDFNNFTIYRNDRNDKRGGGVLIAVKQHITSFPVILPSQLEILWVCITSPSTKHLLGVCYRPPDSPQSFVSDLHDNLAEIKAKFPKSSICLLGDFNYPEIDWSSLSSRTRDGTNFIQLTLDFSLVQLVNQPTRGNNTLDLVLASFPDSFSAISCSDGFSDHVLLNFKISISSCTRALTLKRIFDYNRADYNAINLGLQNFCDTYLPTFFQRSVNDNWLLFKHSLLELTHSHIPLRSFRMNASKPWFNRMLRALKNKKKRLFKAAKRLGTPASWQKHTIADKEYCSAIRKAKFKYYSHDLQSLMTHNPKKFWKTISPANTPALISLLNDTGAPINQEECPTVFNNYFASVFTQEDHSTIPPLEDVDYQYMSPIEISVTGIASLINNLKISTSAGVDDISTKILKNTVIHSSNILCYIFRQSLTTGEIPNDWKIGKIIPIFKSGDKTNARNYRPISLTSVSCKILEHIIVSGVAQHLDSNNFFFTNQHGFRKGFSCDTQLLEFTNELLHNMDENFQTDCIFLDFSKAFDRVAHSRLIAKITSLNLDSSTTSWIRNFLSSRKQFTVVNDHSSPFSDVLSGVPQGSVLGPLLFLIYINDLPSNITSTIRLFADDCIIYRKILSSSDHLALQSDLDHITAWCTSWQMSLNTEKCKLITFSRKKSVSSSNYLLNNTLVSRTLSYKYLGVHFTSNLCWSTHIQKVTAKASRTLGYLKRNLHGTPATTRKLAYQTFVRPQLEYASPIWSPHQAYLINSLELVQNRAARFISRNYNRHSSVTSIKSSLSLSTLQSRRIIALICLFHKIVYSVNHSTLPLAQPYRTSRRLNNPLSFQRISGRTVAFNSSALPQAIIHWNGLPEHIVKIRDPTSFRAEVTAIFSKY